MKVSLTGALVVLFLMLVLIESAFVGILCVDIKQADDSAQLENSKVIMCQQTYTQLKSFDGVMTAMAIARDQPSPQADVLSAQAQKEFLERAENICRQQLNLGIDAKTVESLQSGCRNMLTRHLELDKLVIAHADTAKAIKRFAVAATYCFQKALKVFREGRQILDLEVQQPSVLNLAPQQLLGIAAAVNIVYLLAFAFFVGRYISRPVSRLAEECDKIKQGLVLEKQKFTSSEIGVLQQSFQTMSQQIVNNDRRRKGYIALMQTVQMGILENARKHIHALQESQSLQAKAKTRLQKAATSISTLIDLLHSMTDLLGEDQMMSTTIQSVKLKTAKLVHDVASGLEALLQARSIKLELEAQDYAIVADPTLIGRVLLNLMSNAIKYSPEGGKVAVSIRPEANVLRFEVRDEGPGISEQGRQKLFQRYSMLAASDGVKRAGTGLGLVICKEFVEAHGGSIGCDSEVGRGSCFWFTLPLSQAAKPGKGTQSVENTKLPQPRKKRSKSIRSGFIWTLLCFIAIQTILFLQLHNNLTILEQQASKYSVQKQQLLETQELLLEQAYVGRRLQLAGLSMNQKEAERCIQSFQNLGYSIADFASKQTPGSELYKTLFQARLSQQKLIEMVRYGISHIQEILQDREPFRAKVEATANKTVHLLFQANVLFNSQFQDSVDWSRHLRYNLMTLLSSAALADLLVIAAGAFFGLKTTKRILILKAKAEQFSQGKSIDVSLTGNDELTLLDARLCAAANAIQEAEQQRQELMAIINHDLRTPLSSILGVLETVSQGIYGALPAAETKLVEETQRDLLILLGQVNDLLLFEKIESGSYEAQIETLDLTEIVNDSLANLTELSNPRNVRVQIENKAGSGAKISSRSDRVLLTRLLAAVIKNAMEASPADSEVRVSLLPKTAQEPATVLVQDNGKGISPSLLPIIFDRFRLLDGKPLHGLGLPLAQKICRIIGGSIRFVESSKYSTCCQISLGN